MISLKDVSDLEVTMKRLILFVAILGIVSPCYGLDPVGKYI